MPLIDQTPNQILILKFSHSQHFLLSWILSYLTINGLLPASLGQKLTFNLKLVKIVKWIKVKSLLMLSALLY